MLAPTATAAPHFKLALRSRPASPRDPVRDAAIADRLFHILDRTRLLAGVWPLPGEPDLRPLLHRLHHGGVALALPVVVAADRPLAFRRWRPDCVMERGPHGTRHPALSEPAVSPGIILVPLLAFDRHRNRLGRGGGFYDRTLAASPDATAIGFAYADAEIDQVPTEPHDRALDMVVTERESL